MKNTFFAIGDAVTWTRERATGNGGIQFTSKEGKIIALHDHHAVVKLRNGRTDKVHYGSLRKEGEKSHLTEVFETLAGGPPAP